MGKVCTWLLMGDICWSVPPPRFASYHAYKYRCRTPETYSLILSPYHLWWRHTKMADSAFCDGYVVVVSYEQGIICHGHRSIWIRSGKEVRIRQLLPNLSFLPDLICPPLPRSILPTLPTYLHQWSSGSLLTSQVQGRIRPLILY